MELAARLARKAAGMRSGERKADLLCRLGLLCWDALGDLEAAAKYLEEAQAHPEAMLLRLQLAVSTGDRQGLRKLQREAGGALSDSVVGDFYRACAQAWLFHFADPDRAARAAQEGLRRSPGDASTRAVLTLALELSGQLQPLIQHLSAAGSDDGAALRRLATLVDDPPGRGAQAAQALHRLRALEGDDAYVLERFWERAQVKDDARAPVADRPEALLRQKLALLGPVEGSAERDATRFLLAQHLLTTADGLAEGLALLDELAESSGAWGGRVALELKRRVALTQADRAELAHVTWALGVRCGAPRFKVAYLVRAAELYEAEGMKERALACHARLLAEASGAALAMAGSERLLLGLERNEELVELYERAGLSDAELQPRLLERAAHVLESRQGNVAEAFRRWWPAAESLSDLWLLGSLARLGRGAEDLPGLGQVYGQAVSLLRHPGDERRAALYASAAGTVALARGDVDDAQRLLSEALTLAPEDLFAHTALLGIYRRSAQWPELVGALGRELELAHPGPERAGLHGEIGRIALERLGDPAQAETHVRQGLELNPNEPSLLHLLAQVCDAKQRYREAIELRRKAVVGFGASFRSAVLLCEIGDLLVRHLADAEQAEGAYLEALELDDALEPALDALCTLYRRQQRRPELAQALQRRLELVEDDSPLEARLQLELREVAELDPRDPQRSGGPPGPPDKVGALLEAGSLHEAQGEHDAALQVYGDILRLEPGNRDAFTAAERLCYRLKRWREAMEVYDNAIALVEQRQPRAYRLADLYSRRGQLQLQFLSQPGEAAASYLKVLQLEPDNDNALGFLESIFSKQGDWAGLLVAYEQRAAALRDVDKRVETLRRAARVAAAKLKDADEAARQYESLHRLRPKDGEALDALERHYERRRDWERLVAVLEARLVGLRQTPELVPLHLRIGNIYEEGLRDVDAAVDHYQRVLEHSDGHREALEALSRIYESTEKWTEFLDVTRRLIRVTGDRSSKALLYFKCGSVMEARFAKGDDAIRYYEAALKTSPSCLPAVHGLRDLFVGRQQWSRVLETLEQEVGLWQEPKERAGVLARTGCIHQEHLGDLDKAITYYESALAVDPRCATATRALFEITFERQEWERAAELSRRLGATGLRAVDPAERSELCRRRGLVARHTGDIPQAAEHLVTALELQPENLEALDVLTDLWREQPDAFDFDSTFRWLEKVYQRRDRPAAQARGCVARGTILEQQGDLDSAIGSYTKAVGLAPQELAVLRPLVRLLLRYRRVTDAIDELEGFVQRVAPDDPAALDALLEAADICSTVRRDTERATALLGEVLARRPHHREALLGLAQERALQGLYSEARQLCETLVEEATAAEDPAPPRELGRYTYYLGHVADRSGDEQAAHAAYGRALELSPGYPPPAVTLARHHARRGDLPRAESLLTDAARWARERGSAEDELRLRHHLAVLQAQAGQRAAALEELGEVVPSRATEPETEAMASARVTLARLYAEPERTLPLAVQALREVLRQRPDHLAALRLLADLQPVDDVGGRLRPLRVLQLMGLARGEDLDRLAQAEAALAQTPRRLTSGLRGRYLAGEAVRGPLGQLWMALQEHLERRYEIAEDADGLRAFEPNRDGADPLEVARSLGLAEQPCEVVVARRMKRPLWITGNGSSRIVIREADLSSGPAETRFMLAWAMEYLRSGFSLLSRLGPSQRAELGLLLQAMATPEAQRGALANELLGQLSRQQSRAVERVITAAGDVVGSVDVAAWMRAVDSQMSKVALLLSDDLRAAARASGRLAGVETAVEEGAPIVFRAIPGGQNLLRFYLSANYYELHKGMVEVARSTQQNP